MCNPPLNIAILASEQATSLAAMLQLPCVTAAQKDEYDALLFYDDDRLSLTIQRGPTALIGGTPLCVRLEHVDGSSPMGRSNKQPIAKAVGLFRRDKTLPKPTIIDATAGLGEDSWLLASLGCNVTAIERHPIIAALLHDGLARAEKLQPDIAARIEYHHEDAATYLADHRAEVVYLDPMFPPRKKITERKAMRVLRLLAGDDDDAARLFDAAVNAATKRVVVKRPLHAPPLVDTPPTTVHKGSAMRYDVYAVANL